MRTDPYQAIKRALRRFPSRHFKDPWLFSPFTAAVAALNIFDSADTVRDSSTTNFFTQMANLGLQDTTNWTADTYKTLLNVSSGKGLVAALVGPTTGGAETTTFRFTVDGVQSTVAVVASGATRRAVLLAGGPGKDNAATAADFTTASIYAQSRNMSLAADKSTFADMPSSPSYILPWRMVHMFGVPCLQFNTSLLIEAKNSANITNATATAYSAVMYRLGL